MGIGSSLLLTFLGSGFGSLRGGLGLLALGAGLLVGLLAFANGVLGADLLTRVGGFDLVASCGVTPFLDSLNQFDLVSELLVSRGALLGFAPCLKQTDFFVLR